MGRTGPPNFNLQGSNWQVQETLRVTFPSMARLAAALSAARTLSLPALQSVWINGRRVTAWVYPPAALAAGYTQAVSAARQTAEDIARADHVSLERQLSITEGAISQDQCGAVSGCATVTALGVTPPALASNQEWVAVTVTYAIRP